jgi:Uma2 family endonuclease
MTVPIRPSLRTIAPSPARIARETHSPGRSRDFGAPLPGGARSELATRLACGSGWRIAVAPTLRLGGGSLVPDIAGWRPGRWSGASDAGGFELAPDWVCEIRQAQGPCCDPAEGRARYAAQGIDWLWSVDRRARRLEAFAFFRGAWTLFATLGAGDDLRVAPFREIDLPPGALWEA